MQIQATRPFQPATTANAVRFGHVHGPNCNHDTCDVSNKPAAKPTKKEDGIFARLFNGIKSAITGVINWVKNFFGGFFSDMKTLGDNITTHGKDNKKPAESPAEQKPDAGHVHGPNCKH